MNPERHLFLIRPHLTTIVTFLDLPDLAQLSSISSIFASIASDPALHRLRLLVIAPSRIDHFLCAAGGSLRSNVGDLIHRGVMRGLGIERRWRNGLYLYSPQVNFLKTPFSDELLLK